MSLRVNAVLVFALLPDGAKPYLVEDAGIRLTLTCADPGPGEPNHYSVFITDTELAAATTTAQRRTLGETKLKRCLRADGIASRLDPLIGQSITVA